MTFSGAGTLDVIDHGGEQTSRRVMLKEGDGLPNEPGIQLIAKVSDSRMTDGLNQEATCKFRQGLEKIYNQKRDRKDRPNIVNRRREKLIEINRVADARNLEQGEGRIGCARIQDTVKNQGNHQGDEGLGYRDESEQHHSQRHPDAIRPDITQ